MEHETAVYHNSHDVAFRKPFGAAPCDSSVWLGLAVSAELQPSSVRARLWVDGSEKLVSMFGTGGDGSASVMYECELLLPSTPTILWYYFIVELPSGTVYYCNNAAQRGGVGQMSSSPLGSFQVTVFRRDFNTPDWLKDCVMYQIFVDRFCKDLPDGACPRLPPESVFHCDWNDEPLTEPQPGHAGIRCRDFFGGNLAGVLKKMPYLQSLGIGLVYLNPIFEARSNHKYDTGDYCTVDAGFGDNDTFRHLCAQARQSGIRIILDGVFSHTGSDSIYFNREGRYAGVGAFQSTASPFFPWYRFRKHPGDYECWWNIDTLPDVDERAESFQAFIMGDSDSVIRKWMRLGASGWRLDVVDELPDTFLKKLRVAVKDQDPEGVIIGEVWEDASNKISYGNPRQFVWGEELDGTTNYPFRNNLLAFLLGHLDARELNRSFMSLQENYPRESFYSAMNMLSSHDVTRAMTILQGAPPEDRLSREEQSRWRPTNAMAELGRKRMKLAVLVQMTFPGVPCIYYGDEAGMTGYRDPFARRPYPWGREDRELLEWHRVLSDARRRVTALRTGDWLPQCPSPDVYGYIRRTRDGLDAFGRSCSDSTAVAFVNRSATSGCSVLLAREDVGGAGQVYRDILTDELASIGRDGLRLDIPPLECRLLVSVLD